jgi:hypothetical protein
MVQYNEIEAANEIVVPYSSFNYFRETHSMTKAEIKKFVGICLEGKKVLAPLPENFGRLK